MDWITPQWIGGTLFLTLISIAGWLITRWARSWETRMVAQSKRLDYHAAKIAEHENKHARQDERNQNVEKTLDRIERGVEGVNDRLDNVLRTDRASS